MYSYNILNLFNHRILQNLKKFVVGLEKRIKRGGKCKKRKSFENRAVELCIPNES